MKSVKRIERSEDGGIELEVHKPDSESSDYWPRREGDERPH